MKKFLFILLVSAMPLLGQNLFETTYNGPEWTQSDGSPTGHTSIYPYGSWTASPGAKEEQITTAANMSSGDGYRGQRHWHGTGAPNNSGGTKIVFTATNELWMRWYMRFQTGFTWDPLAEYKALYFNVGQQNAVVATFYQWDETRVLYRGSGSPAPSSGGSNGWDWVHQNGVLYNGHRQADDSWHYYEIHIKMDTNDADGIAEMWVDGKKTLSYTNLNMGTGTWSEVVVGSNSAYAALGSNTMYIDYDDIAINTSAYIGPLGGGDTTPPSATGTTNLVPTQDSVSVSVSSISSDVDTLKLYYPDSTMLFHTQLDNTNFDTTVSEIGLDTVWLYYWAVDDSSNVKSKTFMDSVIVPAVSISKDKLLNTVIVKE